MSEPLTPKALDLLVRLASDHRDITAQAFTSARQLLRAVKLAAHSTNGTPHADDISSAAGSIGLLPAGLGMESVSQATGIPIPRLGQLYRGYPPTAAETDALRRALTVVATERRGDDVGEGRRLMHAHPMKTVRGYFLGEVVLSTPESDSARRRATRRLLCLRDVRERLRGLRLAPVVHGLRRRIASRPITTGDQGAVRQRRGFS